jgi:hypothetical protein
MRHPSRNRAHLFVRYSGSNGFSKHSTRAVAPQDLFQIGILCRPSTCSLDSDVACIPQAFHTDAGGEQLHIPYKERVRFLHMGIEAVVVLILIIANGFLSMSELAIVSARTARLQQMAVRGNRGSSVAIELAADPNRFLSSVQIGITPIGILNGAFGGATLSAPVAAALGAVPAIGSYGSAIAPILVVLVITYLSLVIGELVPKRLALRRPEAVASLMAPALRILSRVMSPFATLLSISTVAVLKLFGSSRHDDNQVWDIFRSTASRSNGSDTGST